MKTRTKVLGWIVDYAYMARGGAVMTYHKDPPKHFLGYTVDGKVPVILIPGIFGKWAFMKKIADIISFLGHPVYVIPELGYNTGTIPDSAQKVARVVKDVAAQHSSTATPRGAILIGYSKGGLIGKYFLLNHNADNFVRGMITIATPFSGSSFMSFLPSRAVQELHSKSEVILAMKHDRSVNHLITSISPEYDNHVWSDDGSHLDGAKNVRVPVSGHHKTLFDDTVIVEVCSAVEKITKEHFTGHHS